MKKKSYVSQYKVRSIVKLPILPMFFLNIYNNIDSLNKYRIYTPLDKEIAHSINSKEKKIYRSSRV